MQGTSRAITVLQKTTTPTYKRLTPTKLIRNGGELPVLGALVIIKRAKF
jgi:hypothetical protein